MLDALERHLGLPRGEIKVYVLVEQIEACFQLMEIRAALGLHFVGFNTGRWDYINSVSDAASWDPAVVNPNIDAITMTYGYMRVYEDRVRRAVNTPDRQGRFALWQGGMEPNIPVGSPAGVQASMARATAGAEREQREGASGKWVAHWKMVHIVRPVWEKAGEPNQLGRKFPRLSYAASDAEGLFLIEPAARTIRGARDLISVALQYGNAFGRGYQAAALKPADFFGNDDVLYLMEDMATGEIRLSILWEWVHKKARMTAADPASGVAEGELFTLDLCRTADRRGIRKAAAREQPRRPRRLEDYDASHRAGDRRDVRGAAVQAAVVRGPAEHQPRGPGSRDGPREDRSVLEGIRRRRNQNHRKPGLRLTIALRSLYTVPVQPVHNARLPDAPFVSSSSVLRRGMRPVRDCGRRVPGGSAGAAASRFAILRACRPDRAGAISAARNGRLAGRARHPPVRGRPARDKSDSAEGQIQIWRNGRSCCRRRDLPRCRPAPAEVRRAALCTEGQRTGRHGTADPRNRHRTRGAIELVARPLG